MYIPQHFIQNDPAELAELINGNNFGTLVSVVDQRPFATHLPFVYDQAAACLRAHMARSNPHWQSLASASDTALVIFQGPHAYVSPSWYNAPGVPTWNYVTVHVYGSFRIIENPQEHQQLLEDLTERHEASQTTPWVAEFDSAPVGDMIGSTVAFEITVTEIQGKFKLNQNRSSSDRTGVIDALENEGSDNATGIAGQMRRLT